MIRRHAARAGLVGTVAGVAMMALAAVAFACTNLATLNLSSSAGAPGTNITATGSSFSTTAKGASSVVLHFNSATGPALATAIPDGAGNITATFTVPQSAQPGYAVIVATQTGKDGSSSYGTPARATFQVTANGNAPTALQPVNNGGLAQAANSGGNGILALTIGLGVLGLALFGAGLTAFVRQARRREVGVPAKVRSE